MTSHPTNIKNIEKASNEYGKALTKHDVVFLETSCVGNHFPKTKIAGGRHRRDNPILFVIKKYGKPWGMMILFC
jgi:hypothetical protein